MGRKIIADIDLDCTNRSLLRLYVAFNKAYFDNSLDPEIDVRFSKVHLRKGMAEYDPENEVIIIDKRFKRLRRLTCFFLLHEMAHVSSGSPDHGEGTPHDAEMMRLAQIGALSGLW